MRRVFVNPLRPHRDAVQEAAAIISRGGIVAIPTDTLYGLAVNPYDANAVGRLFEVKRRAGDQGLPLIAFDVEQMTRNHILLSPAAARLAAELWPGPLTLLVDAPGALAPGVTGGTGRVAVRVPDHVVARAICRAAGHPLTATSANVSGEPATADPDVVERTLGDRIELLIDAGLTRGGPPSTIVDVASPAPTLVRAGAVEWERVVACLRSA